jgi:uncharacterized protein (TIGR04442 family)
MYRDIRLHGVTDNLIEYYAVAAGSGVTQLFLAAVTHEPEGELHFFAGGNEFIIGQAGVHYRGNGGSCCEYMFGVDRPLSDLAREDVINRLVMYGARYETEGRLAFSDTTNGVQSFDRLFFDGNAVCNYFFFVASPRVDGPLSRQQEELVRLLGRTIKRSAAIGRSDETSLLAELLPLLDDTRSQLFIFSLINRKNREYHDLFQTLYFASKKISDPDFARLTALAEHYGIDRYQQERIRIDVMYRHPANMRIVDEYRNILVACHHRGKITTLENARLTRLKTLSVRSRIPGALFHTLDELLRKDRKIVAEEEPDYLGETRQILEGLFLHGENIDCAVDRDDLIRLLHAKKQATENRDHGFEAILLDATKKCDEQIRDGADLSLLEGFSAIITYFDRYDAAISLISQLAFMENYRITEEMIRSLLGNRRAFDELRQGLFEELFVTDLLQNSYLGKYGRRKVSTLLHGLNLARENRIGAPQLLQELLVIDHEERLSSALLERVRDRIRNFYAKYATRDDQETLKREIGEELTRNRLLDEGIPDDLFHETILTIRKEALYLQTLLPRIIDEQNGALREDFIGNSGLDRFTVEELEREYCEINHIPAEELSRIRAESP